MICISMVSYYKPWYYTVSHILIGFSTVWYPIIGILALIYQLGQLFFNVRVFPIEWKISEGNSIEHTFKKLFEILLGFVIGLIVKMYNEREIS